MYSRYTAFRFDPDDRTSVHQFWETVGGPVAARQPGFRGGLVLESNENAGVVRAVTMWDDMADFERFSTGPEHDPIVNGIKATSMSTTDRDGLGSIVHLEPLPAEVRVVHVSINEGAADRFVEFWSTQGKAIVESAPGCLRADAYVDRERGEAMLCFQWRTVEDGQRFRESAIHNETFAPAIEQYVTPITRLCAAPVLGGAQ